MWGVKTLGCGDISALQDSGEEPQLDVIGMVMLVSQSL